MARSRGFRPTPAPKGPQPPSLPKLSGLPPLVQGPRGSIIRATPIQPTYDQFIASAYFQRHPLASYPEYLTWWVLTTRLKMLEYVDFQQQAPELGEYIRQVGSTIVDFLVTRDVPFLAMPVQGMYFHPHFGNKLQADLRVFRDLKKKGFDVIPLDEDDLLRDAAYTVRLAVNERRDISRYVGEF